MSMARERGGVSLRMYRHGGKVLSLCACTGRQHAQVGCRIRVALSTPLQGPRVRAGPCHPPSAAHPCQRIAAVGEGGHSQGVVVSMGEGGRVGKDGTKVLGSITGPSRRLHTTCGPSPNDVLRVRGHDRGGEEVSGGSVTPRAHTGCGDQSTGACVAEQRDVGITVPHRKSPILSPSQTLSCP